MSLTSLQCHLKNLMDSMKVIFVTLVTLKDDRIEKSEKPPKSTRKNVFYTHVESDLGFNVTNVT